MPAVQPTFREALRFWAKLGCISFGGPAGQIAVMHRELVERKQWIDQARFLHALNFCMLLPGPEATQLATYCGWRLHGIRGGLAAGLLFVLPGAFLLWLLSWVYVTQGHVPAVAAIFHGLKAAVLAIVVSAVWRVGRKALKGVLPWLLAAAAFGALFFGKAPFPVVVLGALTLGFIVGKFRPDLLAVGEMKEEVSDSRTLAQPQESGGTWRIAIVGMVLWFAPIVIAGLVDGWSGLYAQLGWFFSKAAVVTFGGAYAVLPYVGQQAVEHYHWLTTSQMVDGLAFAETTPGPLIMVLQFVGFLAGWQQPGIGTPLLSATLGAAMTTWVTFVPTYLFILLGAPHLERWRENRRLSAALAAVTAAVVGVILNLAVWFAWHTIVTTTQANGETLVRVDGFAVVLSLVALAALLRFPNGLVAVVIGSGLAGLLWG